VTDRRDIQMQCSALLTRVSGCDTCDHNITTTFWYVTPCSVSSPTFRRNILIPYSGSKLKPRKKPKREQRFDAYSAGFFSQPWWWKQYVPWNVCELLPDYTASHPRSILLNTIAISLSVSNLNAQAQGFKCQGTYKVFIDQQKNISPQLSIVEC
jgi:hypothetical protein